MANTINANDYYLNMEMTAAVQRASSTKEASLGLQDFLKLLVAQLQNQDMMNPMGDTEFIAQMAQFSSLQSINSMTEQNNTAYAVSLVGKEVTAAKLDNEGKLVKESGMVTGVSLFEGQPMVYIGDKSFPLQSIMTVGKLPEPPEETDDANKPDTDSNESETKE